MFNMQQLIKHVLFDIYWQNMKFNIQKYIGDVLSGGDGWPISLLVQRGARTKISQITPIKHKIDRKQKHKTQN